ncbi:hypothetical protein QFX18_19310 [Saccharophagus degradans]|uniref:hypothetical protein n=1 Tax=Saccharophagus degradans TaxID=86304 RepID=UPI002477DBAE|nr:hypothetical protein [Saccharophagus degradans]WGO98159.1 hypothetical protein QFX18_19310 [Saccharophagus degradans]
MYNFNDNLDVVDEGPLMVKAKVSLLCKKEGGRHTPIFGSVAFRPNHNFGDAKNRNFHIGQINFEQNDIIHPGEQRIVQIRFLNVRGLKELLKVGLVWRIQEGPTLIGYGEVIDVQT